MSEKSMIRRLVLALFGCCAATAVAAEPAKPVNEVFICRPCPVPEPGVLEEIKRIDALAAEMKLGVIDMHAALAGKPQMLPDRVHPNTEGAGEMAKAAFAALTAETASKAK